MKNQTNLNFRIDWKENGSATINLSKPIVAIYQKKKKMKELIECNNVFSSKIPLWVEVIFLKHGDMHISMHI